MSRSELELRQMRRRIRETVALRRGAARQRPPAAEAPPTDPPPVGSGPGIVGEPDEG